MNQLNSKQMERVRRKYGDGYTEISSTIEDNQEIWQVTCPDHGEFKITPHNFLHYRGCPLCRGVHPRGLPDKIRNKELRFYIAIAKLNDSHIQAVSLDAESLNPSTFPLQVVYFKEFKSVIVRDKAHELITLIYPVRREFGNLLSRIYTDHLVNLLVAIAPDQFHQDNRTPPPVTALPAAPAMP